MKNKLLIKHRNRPINLNEIRNKSSAQVSANKFPTFFRVARAEIADLEQLAEEDNLDAAFLESRPIYAIFRIKSLKKTKRNLRKYLKDEGEATGRKCFLYFGEPHITTVYRNPIIQNFFEFSLYYSWIKEMEISTAKAKTLFMKACKVSLNLPLDKKSLDKGETQIFYDFLDFTQGNTWYFDGATLPNDKRGRQQKESTPIILQLIKQGRNNSQIAGITMDSNILSELKKTYLSDGFNETKSQTLAEKEFKHLRIEEMKRIASIRRSYSSNKKTDKKTEKK